MPIVFHHNQRNSPQDIVQKTDFACSIKFSDLIITRFLVTVTKIY